MTKFVIKECPNCSDSYNHNYFFDNENFIEIKTDLIEQEKGDIKKIFEVLNNDVRSTETEHCKECNQKIRKKLKTKFYNLSKYLIIFIDKGFKLKENEMENLDIINFEKKEVESFSNEHIYKYELISMLTENNGNYNYYYRKEGKRFTKNNKETNSKGETVHSLEEISENIIILYYCDTERNDNENIINNNDNDKKSQNTLNTTEQTINAQNEDLNNQGIIFNNNFNINIYGNNNINDVNKLKLENEFLISGSGNKNSNSNTKLNNNNFNNNLVQQNNPNPKKQNSGNINVKIKNNIGFEKNSGAQMNNNFFNQQNNNNFVPHSSNQIRNNNMNLNQNYDENRQHS